MAKTLALNIKINSQGGEKVIKNIGELEEEIAKLSEEIKTLDFGTEEYKKTAAALNTLKSEFKDVEKEFEGIDTEQKLSALAGAVEAVSGAFLIAGSAARTFGADAKSVEEIERLEQQALEAVNIALGVRQLLEGALQARILLRNSAERVALVQTKLLTVAQTAYNAVVGTSTGLLRAFRLALAATGIGLAVVAITELVSRLKLFNKETENSNEALDNLGTSLKEAAGSSVSFEIQTKSLTEIIKDGEKPYKERVAAYKDLQKLVPELADVTFDEAVNTERLNEAIKDQSTLILLRARLKALEEYLIEQEKARIAQEEEQRQFEQATAAVGDYLELQQEYYRAVQGGFQGTIDEYEAQQKALQETARQLAGNTEEVEDNTEATQDNNSVLALAQKTQEEIYEILGRQNERIEENSKNKDKNKEEQDKLNKSLEEYARKIKELSSAFNDLEFSEQASTDIIDKANSIIEKQNELLEERAKILGLQIGENDEYTESLRRLVGAVIIPDDTNKSLENLQDNFAFVINTILEYGKGIDDINGSTITLGNATDNIIDILSNYQRSIESLTSAGLSLERAQQIITANVGPLAAAYSKLNEEQQSQIINFLKSQEQANILIDDLNTGIRTYNNALKEGDEPLQLANQANFEIFNLIVKTNEALENRIKNFETEEEIRNEIEKSVAQQLFDTQDLNTLSEEQLNVVRGTTDLIFEQTKFYGDVLKINKELEGLTQQISDNIKEQGENLTDSEFLNLFEKIKKDAQTNLPELKKFFNELSADTSNLTEEQLTAIKNLLNGIQDASEWDGIKSKISTIAQEVSNLVGRFQQIAQAQISLELERLAAYEEQTLAIIGDETEKQREKQKEFQEEINKQRFELEKRARIQELQFAIATGIAGGAQAVINALALPIPPPGPQIIAGLYAGLTAVELATINSQLSFVKSTQYVPARRGGLVVGPDHENGGVMANGGLVLEGGEAVLNRNAVSQFGDLLSNISVATGGRALTVDDSRIVQEIRQQNQRPIKTYVLYEDIKDTNKINSKLEQISRL